MYDYLILTAAITRPDLHAELFTGHLALVGDVSVKWLVNIDDVGNGHSVEATAAQLRRLLDRPNVDLEILQRPGPGCFYRAARALAARAEELLGQCRTGVVWLEDDWASQRPGAAGRTLTALRLRLARTRAGKSPRRCPGDLRAKQRQLADHEHRRGSLWFVSLVPRSRVSFNPGIWSKALFREAVIGTLAGAGEQVDDPETLCADPLNEPSLYARLAVFVDPRYQDAGRLWSARAGLRKWHKDAAGLRNRGAVSYQPPDPAGERAELRLDGALLCPDLLLHSPMRILCRASECGDIGRLRIRGVPSVWFDLVPVAPQRAEIFMHRLHGWSRTYPVKRITVSLRRDSEGVWVVDDAGAAATMTPAGPAAAFWRLPLQAVMGMLVLLVGLPRVLARLDAE